MVFLPFCIFTPSTIHRDPRLFYGFDTTRSPKTEVEGLINVPQPYSWPLIKWSNSQSSGTLWGQRNPLGTGD